MVKARCLQVLQDDRGDQETGDDEEDVDADETGAQPLGPCMEQHHQSDGDGAQSVDVRAIR
jgi:hypothetical protein